MNSLKVEETKCSIYIYLEGEKPIAVSFKLPRGEVQFHPLGQYEQEEIINLIKSIKNESVAGTSHSE